MRKNRGLNCGAEEDLEDKLFSQEETSCALLLLPPPAAVCLDLLGRTFFFPLKLSSPSPRLAAAPTSLSLLPSRRFEGHPKQARNKKTKKTRRNRDPSSPFLSHPLSLSTPPPACCLGRLIAAREKKKREKKREYKQPRFCLSSITIHRFPFSRHFLPPLLPPPPSSLLRSPTAQR